MQLYNSLTGRIEPIILPSLSSKEEDGGGGGRGGAAAAPVPPPLFVMNITDVDDKILAAAAAAGESPLALARRYEAEFWRDWDELNCLRPHVVPRVTEHVESAIVPYIATLVRAGFAYQLPTTRSYDGDNDDNEASEDAAAEAAPAGVYFDVRAFEEAAGATTRYGKLAPAAATDVLDRSADAADGAAANNNKNSNKKRDARDVALWKNKILKDSTIFTSFALVKNCSKLFQDHPYTR